MVSGCRRRYRTVPSEPYIGIRYLLATPPQARCSGQGIWQIPTPAAWKPSTTSSTLPRRAAPPR